MARKILKKKPLVEAIFELRWELEERQPGIKVDPGYKLLVGRLYDKLSDEYPFHEPLPTSSMPDEMGAYVVQHRFRKEKDGWPLVQIGPGIITVNDTATYIWEDFEKRIVQTTEALLGIHRDSGRDLKLARLQLRYIDAMEFDFDSEDIFGFLTEKMKTEISLYGKLFEDSQVSRVPLGMDLRFCFPSSRPAGAMHLRLARGKRREADALLWETMVDSASDDLPKDLKEIPAWAQQAHELADDWFFKLIEGDLLARFE